jgi:hypothetical protein
MGERREYANRWVIFNNSVHFYNNYYSLSSVLTQ